MNSRKRWKNIYPQDNPLALPQAIIREINHCSKSQSGSPCSIVEFLWIHFACAHQDTPEVAKRKCLTSDEWLSVIDEAATVGVTSMMISLGKPLHAVPQLVPICEWAQETYDMMVGIHAVNPLDARDAGVLKQLNADKTRIFINGEHLESARFAEDLGIKLESADGLLEHSESPFSDLPSRMACIGPDGSIYTCGLVLGDQEYCLGHVFERGLGAAITDESLPHAIPAGTSGPVRRCNGCPPLMAQKLQSGSR
ncbi:MAG: hypothetical protein SGI88_18730 [Candidatus Hydrogenedentes bacterium]|nr:hypothetical protein [Candidatus Hydrogenedentota bacterium]